VEWAGFKSKKNGELLLAAENAGYDVLLTVDQSMLHQQRSSKRKLAIVTLGSPTNQIEDLLPLVDAVLHVLESIRPGQILAVPAPE
ncbi:MAG TPA: hypothetical protein VKG25_20905, partial [Bryobacteraceae bacterium]|nr:hypothetical protein [Bryobacteraceae bacterium]